MGDVVVVGLAVAVSLDQCTAIVEHIFRISTHLDVVLVTKLTNLAPHRARITEAWRPRTRLASSHGQELEDTKTG